VTPSPPPLSISVRRFRHLSPQAVAFPDLAFRLARPGFDAATINAILERADSDSNGKAPRPVPALLP
jgi:hypothetical protein